MAFKSLISLQRIRVILRGVLIAGTLICVGGLVCGDLLVQQWLRRELEERGIEVETIDVALLRGQVDFTDIQWHRTRHQFQSDRVTLRVQFTSLASSWREGLSVSLGQVKWRTKRLRGNTANKLNRSPNTSLSRAITLFESLRGVTVNWQQIEGLIEGQNASCTLLLGQSQTTKTDSEHVLAAETTIECAASEKSLGASGTIEISLFPFSMTFSRRDKIRLSYGDKALSFEQIGFQLKPVPAVKITQVTARSGRMKFGVDELVLRRQQGEIYASLSGGGLNYLTVRQVSASNGRTQPSSIISNFELPDFTVDWFNATVSIDGQQLANLRQLSASNDSISLQLTRGDSSVSIAARNLKRDFTPRVVNISGYLELADIDLSWPSTAMIDGSTSFDGLYDIEAGTGELSVRTDRIRVLHPSLALMPFHLSPSSVQLFTRYELGQSSGSVHGTLDVGQISARVHGAIGEEGDLFTLSAEVSPMSCEGLEDLIPSEWVDELDIKFEGMTEPRLHLSGALSQLSALRFRLRGLVESCRVKSVQIPWETARISVPNSTADRASFDGLTLDVLNTSFLKQIDPTYTQGSDIKVGPASSSYVSLSSLPPFVSAVMFLSEEVGFYKNWAVDLGLIQRALRLDLQHQRYVYGGSTITQQLVKNLLLDRRKTLKRKFHELLIADRVYQRVTKDRVLELYLNVIEFGPGIYGIKKAASFYFQKTPSELLVNEAIFLAMLKPDPSRGADYVRRGRTPTHEYWFTRSAQLFKRLVDHGYLSDADEMRVDALEFRWKDGRFLPR